MLGCLGAFTLTFKYPREDPSPLPPLVFLFLDLEPSPASLGTVSAGTCRFSGPFSAAKLALYFLYAGSDRRIYRFSPSVIWAGMSTPGFRWIYRYVVMKAASNLGGGFRSGDSAIALSRTIVRKRRNGIYLFSCLYFPFTFTLS